MSYSKQREPHSLPGCIFCSNWDMCKVKSDSIKKCSSVCLHSLLLCSLSPLRLKTSLKARNLIKECRAELKKGFFPPKHTLPLHPLLGKQRPANSPQSLTTEIFPPSPKCNHRGAVFILNRSFLLTPSQQFDSTRNIY